MFYFLCNSFWLSVYCQSVGQHNPVPSCRYLILYFEKVDLNDLKVMFNHKTWQASREHSFAPSLARVNIPDGNQRAWSDHAGAGGCLGRAWASAGTVITDFVQYRCPVLGYKPRLNYIGSNWVYLDLLDYILLLRVKFLHRLLVAHIHFSKENQTEIMKF